MLLLHGLQQLRLQQEQQQKEREELLLQQQEQEWLLQQQHHQLQQQLLMLQQLHFEGELERQRQEVSIHPKPQTINPKHQTLVHEIAFKP